MVSGPARLKPVLSFLLVIINMAYFEVLLKIPAEKCSLQIGLHEHIAPHKYLFFGHQNKIADIGKSAILISIEFEEARLHTSPFI